MANESADSKTKSSSSSSAAADSYIGSIISLTSKYEIRYEGVLYYLNPQDSTLGLKNVRSYGTEGRKKDGPEIPPSDKVYEYILFRGSDIKDLQVKSSPSSQAEEPIHNDPAIIQSQSASGPSSLPKSSAVSGGSLAESSPYNDASSLNLRSSPNVVPSHQSGAQAGALGSHTAQGTNLSSHAMPNPWSGYNLATNDYAYARQQPIPSTTTSFPTLPNLQEVSPPPAPTNIALSSSSNSLAPMSSLAASNSVRSGIIPTLSPEQLSTHPTNLLQSSMKSSLSSYPSIVANQLNVSSLYPSGQNESRIEAPEISNMFTSPMILQPPQSLQSSASSLVGSASGSLLKQSQSSITPDHLSQPRLYELSPAQLYPDHGHMGALNSTSSNSSYLSTTPAVQAPLLPLQPSAQQYTEEFDFDAMNEKFKKDEVWGYLGKTKQRDKMERVEDNTNFFETQGKEEGDGFVAESDSKPAYNKDEFFDTISCNSTAQRGQNGQNRMSGQMRQDTEAFGNFQQRILPGYGGYLSGRGHHRDPYSWGRGYNSGGRGRGGYPRWY